MPFSEEWGSGPQFVCGPPDKGWLIAAVPMGPKCPWGWVPNQYHLAQAEAVHQCVIAHVAKAIFLLQAPGSADKDLPAISPGP